MSLSFPFDVLANNGEMHEVAPDVFWIRLSLPFQLDHVNLWLLRDEDGWALVDTGFPNEATVAFWQQLIDQLDGPIKRLIVTHFHPDHLGLADFLQKKTGASLWISTGEFLTAHAIWSGTGGHAPEAMFEQFREHGLDQPRLDAFKARGNPYRNVVAALPETYHRLKHGDTMVINGRHWHFIVGYGHSPEHLSLYSPELDTLISGDILLPKITTNITVYASMPKTDALGAYLASISHLAGEIPETALVLPSHGLPFRGIRERVRALHDHHQQRLKLLEEACAVEPKSATDLLDTLFNRVLDTHQLLFAMGEAIAHLIYLEHKGIVARISGEDGVVRFLTVHS